MAIILGRFECKAIDHVIMENGRIAEVVRAIEIRDLDCSRCWVATIHGLTNIKATVLDYLRRNGEITYSEFYRLVVQDLSTIRLFMNKHNLIRQA